MVKSWRMDLAGEESALRKLLAQNNPARSTVDRALRSLLNVLFTFWVFLQGNLVKLAGDKPSKRRALGVYRL
jgi:hypothetical protein